MYMYMYIYTYIYIYMIKPAMGVATISRLLKIIGLFLQNIVSFIGLFCKRDI